MCGLAGFVDFEGRRGRAELAALVTAMRDELTHRGPDDAGTWVDPTGRCALAHRRLSIVDLSERGRQPLLTPDGDVGLVFNGEIYDEHVLRQELIGRGYEFRSESDAESLLYLFASAQPAGLARLNGMYAFAVWNASRGRLLLARDAWGKKPLYLARGPGWLAFASELAAFVHLPDFAAEVDRDALGEYLLLQYVHAPRAIWKGTSKLPPGSWATLDLRPDGGEPRWNEGRHFEWHPQGDHLAELPYRAPPAGAIESAAEALRPVLLAAVERRLRSDVPLGAFLSGGIDSALVCAMVTRELGRPLHSFSIGFRGAPESEHELAREAAATLGTEHHEELLDTDALALLPEIGAALDEPLGDSSCLPTWLLSRFTRRHVTVALSGDGGDELFGGYGRYRTTLDEESDWKRRALFLFRQRRPWSAGEAYCGSRWLMLLPDDVRALLGESGGRHAAETAATWARELDEDTRPLIHRLRELDARSYMPGAVLAKVDRMSMRFALEVRCPLLDREVAEFARGLSADLVWQHDHSKPVLRALARRYLPEAAVTRGKLGFGLPARVWTAPGLLALCDELLLAPDARVAGLLDAAGLRRFVEHQRKPGNFSVYQTWTLLILEVWLRAMDERRLRARRARATAQPALWVSAGTPGRSGLSQAGAEGSR